MPPVEPAAPTATHVDPLELHAMPYPMPKTSVFAEVQDVPSVE